METVFIVIAFILIVLIFMGIAVMIPTLLDIDITGTREDKNHN